MSLHIRRFREGFPPGLSWVTTLDEAEHNTGIALGVLKLAAGEHYRERMPSETAWLLMEGELEIEADGQAVELARRSIFDEAPAGVHVPAGAEVMFRCKSAVELTVYRSANRKVFTSLFFHGVPDEHRCRDVADGTCYRLVRTILDRDNAHPDAELVLGEVVMLPGRWAGYPPHKHPQPEIYHFRFNKPQGFGFSGLDDEVVKVRSFDTIKIMPGVEHPQAAAPGYAMYFSWVIRHLPEAPYKMPEFGPEHRWVLEPDAAIWQPPSPPSSSS